MTSRPLACLACEEDKCQCLVDFLLGRTTQEPFTRLVSLPLLSADGPLGNLRSILVTVQTSATAARASSSSVQSVEKSGEG